VTAQPALRTADVLLVEDDAGDALLTTEACARYRVHGTLHVAGDGEQAMQFLRRTGDFSNAPRPGLILLDLNLPRRSGLEVLADVKSDHDLRSIPVVILTTSQAEEDISRSHSLHANATSPTHGLRALQRGTQADQRLLSHAGEAAELILHVRSPPRR